MWPFIKKEIKTIVRYSEENKNKKPKTFLILSSSILKSEEIRLSIFFIFFIDGFYQCDFSLFRKALIPFLQSSLFRAKAFSCTAKSSA